MLTTGGVAVGNAAAIIIMYQVMLIMELIMTVNCLTPCMMARHMPGCSLVFQPIL